jgi:hypothetical protein
MLLSVGLAGALCGCMSPEQRAEWEARGSAAREEVQAQAAAVQDLMAKLQAGEITPEVFAAAVAAVNDARALAEGTIREADVQTRGRPWAERIEAWIYLLMGATGLGSVGISTILSRWSRGVRGLALFRPGVSRDE